MRNIILAIIALISIFRLNLYSQTKNHSTLYSHKVVVEEILQTKNYTYLHVKERVKEKDSIQWLALPLFEPTKGDVYYFESGLQMGQFQSKELNKTFEQILFLDGISRSPEVSDKNIAHGLTDISENKEPQDTTPAVIHTVVVQEVLQTSGYTYLRVKEGDNEEWLASVKISASVGQTYTFDDAAPMNEFTSKELKRTFKKILFLAKINLVKDSEKK